VLRVHVVARRPPPEGVEGLLRSLRKPCENPWGSRKVYFLGAGWEEAPVYRGCAPAEAEGPLVVEEPDTTLVVPPGWRLRLLDTGVLLAERG
jgi:N-methylhydantoinase A